MTHRKPSAMLIVIFLLSIFISSGLCQNVGPAATEKALKSGLELKVMTFNIRYGTADDGENRWENRRQMIINVLHDNKPDVVGLQEALDFQLREIRHELAEYGQIGVAREDGKTKGEYCAILYRQDRLEVNESGTFWFSDTPDVPGSSHWGNANVRICTWARFVEKKSGGAFYLYNLHLDHASQVSREKSVVLLSRRIRDRKHPDAFIITGDFNSGESNPAILYLKGKTAFGKGADKAGNPLPLVDSFRVLYPDANDVGTFNEFAGHRKGEKIDYIFTAADVQVVETQIIHAESNGRYPSDHFPVTALLRLPSAPKLKTHRGEPFDYAQDKADLV
jgi:endonuclease/exonuclease/phosphatase family metal-dependent hydrolase